MRWLSNPGLMVLSLAIAVFLWAAAHGSAAVDRGFDVPVTLQGVPDDLVPVDLSSDAINIRVLGTRAALRNIEPEDLEYVLDVSGARPGPAGYEVEVSRIVLPRSVRIVSRSPAEIDVVFDERRSRSVRVRPEVRGRPAEGYLLTGVDVAPLRVRITGAERDVRRLSEIPTEVVDVSGLTEPLEREVRLTPGGGHVWLEKDDRVKVRIRIEPDESSDANPSPPESGQRRG